MSFFTPVFNVVFPVECVICRSSGEWLCERCRGRIDAWLTPGCPGCGKPSRAQLRCSRCTACPLAGVLVAAPYPDRIVQKAIGTLKYHFARQLAIDLAKLLVRELEAAATIESGWAMFDAVLPVPLHRARLRYRGFNQSEALAAVVSQHFNWPLRSELLVRHRFTSPQAKLEDSARRKNLFKAFIVPNPPEVVGKRILLVDDVVTTGATLEAASEALLEGGAAQVRAVVLASG